MFRPRVSTCIRICKGFLFLRFNQPVVITRKWRFRAPLMKVFKIGSLNGDY